MHVLLISQRPLIAFGMRAVSTDYLTVALGKKHIMQLNLYTHIVIVQLK